MPAQGQGKIQSCKRRKAQATLGALGENRATGRAMGLVSWRRGRCNNMQYTQQLRSGMKCAGGQRLKPQGGATRRCQHRCATDAQNRHFGNTHASLS